MDQKDQDFLAEIRALLDEDGGETQDAAPESPPTEPAAPAAEAGPEQKAAADQPDPAPRQRSSRQPRDRQRRKPRKEAPPSEAQPAPEGGTPDRRRKRRKAPVSRPFPWVLLFLTLLVAAGLIYAALQYRADLNAPAKPTVPTETEPQATLPPEDRQTVTFAAAGDVNISDELLASALQADGSYDFSRAFLNVAPVLSRADIAVANLEANFCGEPYGSVTHSAPYALAEALAGAGIDMVQTANSYSISNGIDGLAATLTAVRQAGMEPVGAYADEAAYQKSQGITLCEVNGFKIAFVAFTKGMDNLSLPEGHSHCVNLLYTDYDSTYSQVDTEGINAVLAAAAAQKPDITIALVHWGSEYARDESDSQKSIRSLLLSGGVDVILGTHSHKLGTLEVTTEKKATTVTAYGLGDLYGDDSHAGTQTSVILELEFTMDNLSSRARLTNISYTPIYIAAPGESSTGSYEILDIDTALKMKDVNYSGAVSADTADTLTSALEDIPSYLGDSLSLWQEARK